MAHTPSVIRPNEYVGSNSLFFPSKVHALSKMTSDSPVHERTWGMEEEVEDACVLRKVVLSVKAVPVTVSREPATLKMPRV